MIEAARQGEVTVGTVSANGSDAIAFQLISQDQEVDFNTVVFQSGGEINTALLGGDIEAAGSNPAESIGQIEAGELKALAVFAEEPFSSGVLADVPTAAEEGVDVDITPTTQYRAAFAAGDISNDERAFWERALLDWTETDSYNEYIEDNFLSSVIRTGQELEDFLQGQQDQVRELFQDMGMEVE
jgi:putative tricarboxylic transport membrane protein